ncbi:MAG TPA: DUF2304 domain-containing protein [Acidimicrobiales bacterium]|nr:DUF2304 domain-containing protein [Acidimicrobiales bacterium]
MSTRAHVLVLLVTLSTILFLLRLLRRHKLPARYALLWLSVGGVLVALAASPTALDRASAWAGISYAPATFFLGAITLLFLVVVQFSWELSRLDDRTRDLAEEIAILRIERTGSADEGAPDELAERPE